MGITLDLIKRQTSALMELGSILTITTSSRMQTWPGIWGLHTLLDVMSVSDFG